MQFLQLHFPYNMRRMSPDYSGNAYEHSRGLAYDYNYDPSNHDSPGKAGKLDPYSDDYSIPLKSSPHRSRSPDAYSNAGTSHHSRRKVGGVGRGPMPAISESPTHEYLERSNKLSPSASSIRDSLIHIQTTIASHPRTCPAVRNLLLFRYALIVQCGGQFLHLPP